MSHEKSKRKKNKQPSANKHPVGDDKLDHKPDRVTVSGKIEADFPPNLVEKYDAASDKQESWDRKRFIAEIATIILLFAYTTVALWQGCSAKKSAEAAQMANRPYVGVNGITFYYVEKDIQPNGTHLVTGSRTKNSIAMEFKGEVKNFGPVAGTNFKADWKIFLGGIEPKGYRIPDTPSTIYPTQEVFLPAGIWGDDYSALIQGNKSTL